MNMRVQEKRKVEHIAIIVDESGSMESIKTPTLTGINEQIQTLRKTGEVIDTYVTITKFSNRVEILHFAKPLDQVKDLTKKDYTPNGTTALLDAVGLTVTRLKNDVVLQENEDVSFLVIIASDGMENASKEYSYEDIAKLISTCNETKRWKFVYMGTEMDLSVAREKLHVSTGDSISYDRSIIGTQSAWSSTSNSLSLYRMSRIYSPGETLAASGFYTHNSSNSATT